MTHPNRTSAMEIRVAGDEVLVHDPLHDKVHIFNRSAGFVLELCDGTRTVAELARLLSTWAGIEFARAQRDVEVAVETFAGARLLEE